MASNSNTFDAESVNTDMDYGLASETPETNYFKMMMQDNEIGRIDDRDMDDSVLGGETLASFMNNKSGGKNGSSKTPKPASKNSSTPHDPTPAETLSIVGYEDDISTIANDTVNDNTKAFFNINGTREASQPRIRLFKEYKTPEKPKMNNEQPSPGDDETAPETPPGMIRVPQKSSASRTSESMGKERSKESRKKPSPVLRSKRVYIVAGVLSVILFASIVALSVALSGMRDSGSSSSSASANGPTQDSEDVLDTWPDLETGLDDDENNGQGSDQGGDEPDATAPPLDEDTQEVYDELLTLLVDQGIVSEDLDSDPESPQYQATSWLAADPDYYSYREGRVIQRWTLAVMAYSMDASSTEGRDRMNRGLMDEWLEYSDECAWFSSGTIASCDDAGNFVRLDIQDLNLGGTLPAEISLLSNSLRHIILDGNNLQGPIPTELGFLTLLETLKMPENSFDGPLMTEIGNLVELDRLNLGNNQLTGNIPTEVGNLRSLSILRLDYNNLTGEIPQGIGFLYGLTDLSLNNNQLSGRIPNEFQDLEILETLYIGNNDLTGDFPTNICQIQTLEVISVDCDAEGCECCTECADEIDQDPTTDSPTAAAVQTDTPTECVDLIASLTACYGPDDPFNVVFSNCNPENDDWIGIYEAGQNFESLPNPPVWSWACGTRNCREAVSSGQLALSEVHAANGAWPLDQGSYVMILARNSAQPYTAFAVSEEFIVEEGCRR